MGQVPGEGARVSAAGGLTRQNECLDILPARFMAASRWPAPGAGVLAPVSLAIGLSWQAGIALVVLMRAFHWSKLARLAR